MNIARSMLMDAARSYGLPLLMQYMVLAVLRIHGTGAAWTVLRQAREPR
jgi:hypothetical protein